MALLSLTDDCYGTHRRFCSHSQMTVTVLTDGSALTDRRLLRYSQMTLLSLTDDCFLVGKSLVMCDLKEFNTAVANC